MKIVIAAGIYPPDVGGPATYIAQLVPELQAQGHSVRVVTYSDVSVAPIDSTCGYPVTRVVRGNTVSNYIRYTWQLYSAAKHADVLYAFDHMSAGIPASMVSRIRRISLYIRVGGDFLWERYVRLQNAPVTLRQFYSDRVYEQDSIRFRLMKWVFARARRIFFTTTFQKELFAAPYQLSEDQLAVVENAMPVHSAGMKHSRERKEFLFAGRTLAIATLEQLIEAFVAADVAAYTLTIITEAPEAARLRTYCKERGYQDERISIESQVPHAELLERMRTCHAMIFARLTDISPNTLLEAVSMGVPCICATEIGLEIVNRMKTFDPVSKQAITEAIRYLSADDIYESYRTQMSRITLNRTYTDIATDTLALFRADRNRILVLGNDPGMFHTASGVYARAQSYATLFDAYTVISPGPATATSHTDGPLMVQPAYGSTKVSQFISMWRASRKYIRKQQLQMITTQDPFLFGLLAYGLSKLHRIPFHIQEHGDFFSDPYWRQESIRHRFEYLLGKWIIRRADGIRVVSERSRRTLVERLGISDKKITFVPVYTPPMEPCREKGTSDNTFQFLSIGRFEKQKNLPLLIEAFAQVHAAHPEATLVLYGKGTEQAAIAAAIEQFGVQNAVTIHGWTDDVRSVYCSSDCYVLSSDYEGWGRVIIEAAHCGIPIVMTDVGCAGDVIQDGVSGRVVPLRDVDALASAMIHMFEMPEKRTQYVAAAREAVKELPNQDETLALYEASWKQTL